MHTTHESSSYLPGRRCLEHDLLLEAVSTAIRVVHDLKLWTVEVSGDGVNSHADRVEVERHLQHHRKQVIAAWRAYCDHCSEHRCGGTSQIQRSQSPGAVRFDARLPSFRQN